VAKALKTGAGAQLNVICSPSVAVRVGPQAVAHMLRQYPDLVVKLETRPVFDIYQQLTSQQSDLAISLVPIDHPSLQHQLLAQVGMVVVLPAGHALAAQAALRLHDLAQVSLIRFPVDTTQGATLERLLQAQGVSVPSRVTVRVARDACALVAQGVGAAVIDALTASHLNDPAIVVRPLLDADHYALSALWSKDVPLTRLGHEFVEQVRLGVQLFTQT
jgi:DNA-binding transcriptional LysR family regulator